ncbi:unnamed protein product, partial [Prorocentrum cordatum]
PPAGAARCGRRGAPAEGGLGAPRAPRAAGGSAGQPCDHLRALPPARPAGGGGFGRETTRRGRPRRGRHWCAWPRGGAIRGRRGPPVQVAEGSLRAGLVQHPISHPSPSASCLPPSPVYSWLSALFPGALGLRRVIWSGLCSRRLGRAALEPSPAKAGPARTSRARQRRPKTARSPRCPPAALPWGARKSAGSARRSSREGWDGCPPDCRPLWSQALRKQGSRGRRARQRRL